MTDPTTRTPLSGKEKTMPNDKCPPDVEPPTWAEMRKWWDAFKDSDPARAIWKLANEAVMRRQGAVDGVAEVARLRAIVEKLPKTADGVNYFTDDLPNKHNAYHPLHGEGLVCFVAGCLEVEGFPGPGLGTIYLEDCYSTEAAAREAKETNDA